MFTASVESSREWEPSLSFSQMFSSVRGKQLILIVAHLLMNTTPIWPRKTPIFNIFDLIDFSLGLLNYVTKITTFLSV